MAKIKIELGDNIVNADNHMVVVWEDDDGNEIDISNVLHQVALHVEVGRRPVFHAAYYTDDDGMPSGSQPAETRKHLKHIGFGPLCLCGARRSGIYE